MSKKLTTEVFLNIDRARLESLVERADELLQSVHVDDDDYEPVWKMSRDQWLKDKDAVKI